MSTASRERGLIEQANSPGCLWNTISGGRNQQEQLYLTAPIPLNSHWGSITFPLSSTALDMSNNASTEAAQRNHIDSPMCLPWHTLHVWLIA